MSEKRKVAIVTGAGAGIGRAIAIGLAKEGNSIIVVDIAQKAANETADMVRETGVEALSVIIDISKTEQIEEMVEKTVARFGRIDVLVNNAGIAANISIEELTQEQWDKVIDINLKGAFFCSQAAYKQMKIQQSGKIINISSIAGERGGLFAGAHYSTSKAGLIVLTKCFAISGGKYNITANAVAPGFVETEMSKHLKHKITDVPLGRKATVEEIADSVCFLASEKLIILRV